MNKKEVAEIKKQFKTTNDKIVINNIATYYIKSGDVVWGCVRKFGGMDVLDESVKGSKYIGALDCDEYMDMCKKTLSGQIGKGLCEYEFPNEILMETDGVHSKLMNLVKSELKDQEMVDDYIHFLKDIYAEGNEGEELFITITHASYDVPNKNANDEVDNEAEESGEVFNFIIVNFSPVSAGGYRLSYDEESDMITSVIDSIKTVGAPVNGFMFPTFNERTTDINHVLVFDKKPKEPRKDIIEDILGCNYVLSPEEEREKFNTLVAKVVTGSEDPDSKVRYGITKDIHSQIVDIVEKNSAESETPTLSSFELKNILRKSGVEEDKLKDWDETFEEVMGDADVSLKAVNVINTSKMDIKSADVIINVKANKTDKVVAKNIDGKRCLVVELDDNEVQINGLDIDIK